MLTEIQHRLEKFFGGCYVAIDYINHAQHQYGELFIVRVRGYFDRFLKTLNGRFQFPVHEIAATFDKITHDRAADVGMLLPETQKLIAGIMGHISLTADPGVITDAPQGFKIQVFIRF